MAKSNQESVVKAWSKRVFRAEKDYAEWETKYLCRDLEDYYLGHQEKTETDDDGNPKYVVNLCFQSVEIKIPSLLFYRPKIDVDVREPFEDQAESDIAERTKLLEDTANTFIADPEVGFQDQSTLALQEGFYRFAVVEVGYSGNFQENPNARKPMLHEDGTEMRDEGGAAIMEPDFVLPKPKKGEKSPESVYIRRIPASQFRVAVGANNRLDWSDWCGYWEWAYLEDVKANYAFKNTANLKAQGSWKVDVSAPRGTKPQRNSDLDSDDERQKREDMVKLWWIWDIRTKTRFVLAEGGPKPLLEEKYEYLPFAVMKFHPIMDKFYPLPPMFNWVKPQRALNSTRQALLTHMKRFKRRYTYMDGSIDDNELTKLENGPDGTMAKSNVQGQVVIPVEDAKLDESFWRNIPATKEDFLQISGVGGEARGTAESTTATQASIIDTRARIRESFGRYQVAQWLGQIVRLLLWTIRDRMTLPFIIKRNVDMQAADSLPAALRVASLWQTIKAEDLKEIDYEVSVDVESLSPMNEDTERQQWMAWMSSLTPARLLMMATSDVILRKDLGYFGIRGDKQIREIKKAIDAQIMVMSGMPPLQAVGQAKSGLQPGAATPPGLPGMPGAVPPTQPGAGAPEGSAGPVGPPVEQRLNSQLNAQLQARVPGATTQSVQ